MGSNSAVSRQSSKASYSGKCTEKEGEPGREGNELQRIEGKGKRVEGREEPRESTYALYLEYFTKHNQMNIILLVILRSVVSVMIETKTGDNRISLSLFLNVP